MGSGSVPAVEKAGALLLTAATAGLVLVAAAALMRARVQGKLGVLRNSP
jgi:hypothetical protein